MAHALESPSNAVTVRVRKSETLVTEGPYAETKEVLGGFLLIRADSVEEAREIDAGIPLASIGSVEVRPVQK